MQTTTMSGPLYLQIKVYTSGADKIRSLYLRAADTNRKCSCGYLFRQQSYHPESIERA